MKKNYTEIIFLIDRNTTSTRIENETIKEVNAFIEKKEKILGDIKITTVLFFDNYELLWNVASVEEVRLSENEFYIRSTTSLLDSIGRAIIETEQRLICITNSERPNKVIFVIISNDLKNTTGKITCKEISEMISKKRNENGWEFIFFGKNTGSFLGG